MLSNQHCRELKADTRLSERESEPLCLSDSHYGNVISTLTDAKKNNFADWLFFKPKAVGNQRKYEHLAELLIAMLTDIVHPNKQQLVQLVSKDPSVNSN